MSTRGRLRAGRSRGASHAVTSRHGQWFGGAQTPTGARHCAPTRAGAQISRMATRPSVLLKAAARLIERSCQLLAAMPLHLADLCSTCVQWTNRCYTVIVRCSRSAGELLHLGMQTRFVSVRGCHKVGQLACTNLAAGSCEVCRGLSDVLICCQYGASHGLGLASWLAPHAAPVTWS